MNLNNDCFECWLRELETHSAVRCGIWPGNLACNNTVKELERFSNVMKSPEAEFSTTLAEINPCLVECLPVGELFAKKVNITSVLIFIEHSVKHYVHPKSDMILYLITWSQVLVKDN